MMDDDHCGNLMFQELDAPEGEYCISTDQILVGTDLSIEALPRQLLYMQ